MGRCTDSLHLCHLPPGLRRRFPILLYRVSVPYRSEHGDGGLADADDSRKNQCASTDRNQPDNSGVLNPPTARLLQTLKGLENVSATYSAEVANRLQRIGFQGPIAGAGDCGRHYAQYVAFLLNQPFYGCEENPSTARIKAAAVKLLVVSRVFPLTEELDKDPAFQSLDDLLFGSGDRAATFTLKVYHMKLYRGTWWR